MEEYEPGSLDEKVSHLFGFAASSVELQNSQVGLIAELVAMVKELRTDNVALMGRVGKLESAAARRREPGLGPTVTIDPEVIERLGETEDTADLEHQARGQEYGEEWAKHTATRAELRRLQAFRDALTPDDWDEMFDPPESGLTVGEQFFVTIKGGDAVADLIDASEFWTLHLGNMTDDPHEACQQVRGFVEAAIAVFEAAASSL